MLYPQWNNTGLTTNTKSPGYWYKGISQYHFNDSDAHPLD
ncbi:hypothetical protein LPE509_00335 [Legionella pneumophila subsp. pneumophila LPE509]|nr:hypothetical protein LPE509_00335 [Legionella pneumophila subsp. pneumophila LPE509]